MPFDAFLRSNFNSLPASTLVRPTLLLYSLHLNVARSLWIACSSAIHCARFDSFTHTEFAQRFAARFSHRTQQRGERVLALTTCRLAAFFVFSICFQHIRSAGNELSACRAFKLHVISFSLSLLLLLLLFLGSCHYAPSFSRFFRLNFVTHIIRLWANNNKWTTSIGKEWKNATLSAIRGNLKVIIVVAIN